MFEKAFQSARRVVATATVVALVAAPAGAQITFSPLAGPNGAAYTGHTENGFDVTPTAGDWHQALLAGNPVPSVYGGPIFSPIAGTLQVTRVGGGAFTFGGVDLLSQNGMSAYLLEGSLAGGSVFSQSGTADGSFVTIASLLPAAPIDLLTITLTPDANASSFNVDNIDVAAFAAVPEPASIALLAVGLAVMGAGARRRRTARTA